jgi:hypothetical protein
MNGYTGNCESIGDVCGVDKSVCVEREFQTTIAALTEANVDSYMLFDKQCRSPSEYAPTCTPLRLNAPVGGSYTGGVTPNDLDGDGITNASDNCMYVFNPVRPMDFNPVTGTGNQLDCDRDGAGDVCDPTPTGAASKCVQPYPPFPTSQ